MNEHDDATERDKRMRRMEQDIAEIKIAVLGNLVEGTPGIVGRLRERERMAENHDLRLVKLETLSITYATKKDVEELEAETEKELAATKARLDELEKIKERMVGALLLASALGAAGGGAIVKIFGG